MGHKVWRLAPLLSARCLRVAVTPPLNDPYAGRVPHTRSLRPWRIKTAVACADGQRTAVFERYLKSASSYAFAKKHF